MARLDLEQAGEDTFVGGSGRGGVTVEDRLFGGLVASQASVAAARTTSFPMHSLHTYFLRPGRAEQDIEYRVSRAKQGRNFHVRLVEAWQSGQLILTLQASFTSPAQGVEHADPAPPSGAPITLPNRDALRGRDPSAVPIDVRMATPITAESALPPEQQIWFKPNGTVPEDPVLHVAFVVYASDRTLLDTAWRPHADQGELAGASLDHTVWFHAEPNANDWHLYAMQSPVAAAGRGLAFGGIYDVNGRRIASVTQEGVLRSKPS
jgi:acyl-CoA thioesterase-2